MSDSEATSERMSSANLESSDYEACPSVYEHVADDQSCPHEREPSTNLSLKDEEAISSSGEDFKGFVLPQIWSMNDFLSKTTDEVFRRLRPCFRLPNDVPIRKAYKWEKCYTRDTEDIGFYKADFIVGLGCLLVKSIIDWWII